MGGALVAPQVVFKIHSTTTTFSFGKTLGLAWHQGTQPLEVVYFRWLLPWCLPGLATAAHKFGVRQAPKLP